MIVYLDKEDIVYDFILKVASGQSNLEELWCAPYLGPIVKLDNGLTLDPYERQD
jgi:hypothetical protein